MQHRADRAHGGLVLGDDQLPVGQAQHLPEGPHYAGVRGHPALDDHRLFQLAPPGQVAADIAGQRQGAAGAARAEPAPRGHPVLLAKSSRPRGPMVMSLESSPPIAMTVRAWGYRAATAEDWATISLTKRPPRSPGARCP